jgi:hypothetical protein
MMAAILIGAYIVIPAMTSCSEAPEPPASEPPEWHWRLVDGKRCWFRADALLPREDLIWSYDEDELNRRENAIVKGQRHYTAKELEELAERESRKAEAAREAREEASERRRSQRQRWRRRRERDDDDDD